jgi:hypothetical protein
MRLDISFKIFSMFSMVELCGIPSSVRVIGDSGFMVLVVMYDNKFMVVLVVMVVVHNVIVLVVLFDNVVLVVGSGDDVQ